MTYHLFLGNYFEFDRPQNCRVGWRPLSLPRTACCTSLLVMLVANAAFAAPTTTSLEGAAPPFALERQERGAPLDASRLADRLTPPMMDMQPIIVAQQSGFAVGDVSGPPGQSLPIDIKLPPDNGELFRVIMIRGLPENFKLTAGVSLDDAWAISPAEASRVALVSPDDYRGEFSMEVLFIRGNGESREQQIVNVRIGPDMGSRSASTGSAEVTKEPQKPSIPPELQKSMFERASRMMSDGDIAGARLILSYLAKQGMAGAAFAMGQSFDPGFLEGIYVRGGDPSDLAKAREWYRRAADMGSPDAESRLSALEN